MGKREDTEQQILNAAIKLISEKGYNAAKTNEIAEMANTSEAIIFKYFKTKKGLLTAIVYKAIELLGHELAYKPISNILKTHRERPLDEVMDLVIDDRINLILKNHMILKVLLSEIQYHSDLRDVAVAKVANPIFEDFKDFMAYHREQGSVDPQLDDEVIIQTIFSVLFIGVIKRVIMDTGMDEVALKKEMLQAKKIVLKGIKPE